MESKKAIEYINKERMNTEIGFTPLINGKWILADNAIKAIGIAETEMKEKAIEAHRKSCPYLNDDICAGQSDVVTSSKIDEKCLGKCEYVELFKSLINK